MTKEGALSLIEVLVVIAVTILLVSLVMTASIFAIRAGKGAVCVQNLGSIGKALSLYIEDNGGYLPPYYIEDVYDGHVDASSNFVDVMSQYGVDKSQWFCPLDKKSGTSRLGGMSHEYHSYVYSLAVLSRSREAPPAPNQNHLSLNVRTLAMPGESQLMFDCIDVDYKSNPGVSTGHGDYRNTLFADWHVKAVHFGTREDHCQMPDFPSDCVSGW